MKDEFNFLKELVIVGIIFVGICFGISSFQHNLELKRVYKLLENEKISKLEVMKVALENDRLNKEYILVLQESRSELNDELDFLNKKLQDYKHLDKFQKDLSRHWDER